MYEKTPFLRLTILVWFLALLSAALAQGSAIGVQPLRTEQSLTVSGASNTVVITNGAHLSDLGSGTYEVSVSSDLNTGSGDPDFNLDKVVVWASTPGNPWGWYWVVEEGEPQTIIIPTPIMDVWAFLLDTDASDNTGTATVTFRPCCPPSDTAVRTLEVSGASNTVLITAGAHTPLDSGTYQVSVVSDLNLGSGFPGFEVDKVVVWASSPGDPMGWYWVVEEGKPQTIAVPDAATDVWAFLLDIDSLNNTGSATVTFSSLAPPTPTPTPTPPPACVVRGSVDVVFAMDTSGSMADEFAALCDRISDVVAELGDRGLSVKYRILGIAQTRQCARQTVRGMFPEGTVDHSEDWGPAVVDLASHYPWKRDHTRLIIPMSDEGPQNGEPEQDPGPDRDVIDEAIATAQNNQVIVSPVQGTAEGSRGDPVKVERLMRDLAAGTGGLYFRSTEPASDLADALVNLIGSASCTPVITSISPECDITASTVVTITGQNFLPEATVALRAVGSEEWVPAENVTVVSDTQITFQVPASLSPGTYEVRVTNPGERHSTVATVRVGAGTCPSACPEIPETPYFTHYFRNVTVDGTPAPEGTLVEAFNPRGDLVGCFEVTTPGRYGFMRVYGEDTAASPPIPGMRTGEPVTFKINGGCTDTWPLPVVLWFDDKGYHAVDLSTPCRPDARIPLHSGWNWFSINRMPSDPRVASVLTSIADKYDLVLGESGVYAPPPANPAFNTLTGILPGQGYMIHMTEAAQEPSPLLVNGPLVPSYTPIPLHAGWNWFGYLPERALEVGRALISIVGRYSLVLGELGTYAPPPADPTRNTLSHLEPGRGYLVRMTEAGVLVYPTAGEAQRVGLRAESSQACEATPTPYFTHYYGGAVIDGLSAPAGTVVQALSPRGDAVGCFEVTTSGLYGYMRVYGEDADASPPIPGMRAGEAVTFRIAGMRAASTPSPVTWEDDKGIHEVNLSLKILIDFLPLITR